MVLALADSRQRKQATYTMHMATYRSSSAAGRGRITCRTASTSNRVHGLVATGFDDGGSISTAGRAINEEVHGGRAARGPIAAAGGARRYTGGAGSAASAGGADSAASGGGLVVADAGEDVALGSRQPKGRHGDESGCLKRLHFGVYGIRSSGIIMKEQCIDHPAVNCPSPGSLYSAHRGRAPFHRYASLSASQASRGSFPRRWQVRPLCHFTCYAARV